MKKNVYYCTIILLCILINLTFNVGKIQAQSWHWARTGKGAVEYVIDATDNFGNVFVASYNMSDSATFGTTTLYSGGQLQSIVIKYDSAGNVLWADKIVADSTTASYADSRSTPMSIAADTAGNLLMLGTFSGHISIDAFNLYSSCLDCDQYFLVKYNPSGVALWAKNISSPESAGYTLGISWGPSASVDLLTTGGVATDNSGNIFLTGRFGGSTITIGTTTLTNSGPAGTEDVFVARYDPSGNEVWAKDIGGDSSDKVYSITVASTGNVYIAGAFVSDSITVGDSVLHNPYDTYIAYVAELSSAGTPLWGMAAGGANGAYAVGLTKDAGGDVFLTGGFGDASITFGTTTLSRTYPAAVPYLALFLIRLNATNTVDWTKTIGSPTTGLMGYSVALATCGEVWVAGGWIPDFSPTSIVIDSANIDGHMLYTPAGSRDPVFLAGYNLAGGVIGSGALASGGDDQIQIASDPYGNLYLCADYYTFIGVNFIVGPDTLGYTTTDEIYYLARFNNDSVNIHNLSLRTDTSLCSVPSLTLKAPGGYTDPYLWSNGTTDSTIHIDSSGTFWVRSEGINKCIPTFLTDTFHVVINTRDSIYEKTDTTLCSGGGYTLQAPVDYTSYKWSNGDTTMSFGLLVHGDTTIWVSALDSCIRRLVDTFHIAAINLTFSLGADTFACGPVTLHIPEAGVSYLWENSTTGQDITAINSGTYKATVSGRGCTYSDSIVVSIVYLSNTNFDTTICSDAPISLLLSATDITDASVTWSTGAETQTITVSDTGVYYAHVSDHICSATDTMHIGGALCNCWCVLPNAFAPNGANRGFKPLIAPDCIVTNYSFSVFNRWGQRVFISADPGQYWDGTFNSTPAELSVYNYELTFDGGLEHKKIFKKGDVTLIR